MKNKIAFCVFLALVFCHAVLTAGGQEKIEAVSQILPADNAGRDSARLTQSAPRNKQDIYPAEKINTPSAGAGDWQPLATVSGYARRIKFVSETIGYLSCESGLVYRTQDGGKSWQLVMQHGWSYQWYALWANGPTVRVAGHNIDANATEKGIMRISRDYGATWSEEIVVSKTDWLLNIGVVSKNRNLFLINPWGTGRPYGVLYSFYGGFKPSDWRSSTPTTQDGWYGNQISVRPSGRVDISGINYCTSRNSGINWSCRPSIDPVFDGAVFFSDDEHGWVGGGTISPTNSGWVHATANGGQNWGGRTLNAPFAIRNIFFINNNEGWAMGGNVYDRIGGIYGSTNGGASWTLELSTPHEMVSCDRIELSNNRQRVWCVGFGRNANNQTESKIFTIEK